MKRLQLLTLGLVAAVGLALAGPRDNSLVVGASQEPRVLGDFWAFVSSAAIASEIENFLWAGLEYIDINGNDQAYLATEVPTTENGRVTVTDLGEGKKRIDIHYTLRDDIYWSDGVPITSEDVQFYYEVGKYPGAPVQDPSYWNRVKLTVQDDKNFTVTFEPAYFYDLVGSAIGLAPAHVMKGEWEKTKAEIAKLDPEKDAAKITELFQGFVSKFSTPNALNNGSLVFSGPFTLKKWVAGSNLEMVRNPKFFITPPGGADKYVQKVTYRFITDTNALLVAILGGGIDATSSVALTFDQARAPQLTRRAQGRFDIWAVPGVIWEHAEVNKFTSVQQVKDLMLDNPKTRQAILYAMNRQGLVDAFFDGLQPVADTWVHFADPNANPNVKKYPYDPEKAKQLLAELGWKDLDGDGYLERKTDDGRTVKFEIEYVTTAGNRIRERTQVFFQNDLKKVGIKVKINNAPSSVVFSNDFFSKAYDGSWKGLFEFAWLFGIVDDAGVFTCKDYITGETYVPTPENNYSGVNFGWCNEEFDQLRAKAMIEFDAAKRKEYWQRMQEIWAEELPALPFYWRSNPLVVKKGLVNFVSSTYFGSFGYPTTNAWLIGWAENGAQQVFDQAKYGINALEQ
ncbi:peptide ABC transporter substrate-binding protein [Oceanithermus sp.]|uniref:peptide ABC transporter substrate-binding protein n=1 Tax=Oceanithermus sp. TaxID=2268145 RepID=UPI0025FFE0E7|nr:peptide ABC transporter substrate-binding protein [Oceanithermus sp.]